MKMWRCSQIDVIDMSQVKRPFIYKAAGCANTYALKTYLEKWSNLKGGHRRESTVNTVHDNDKRPEASPEALEESY